MCTSDVHVISKFVFHFAISYYRLCIVYACKYGMHQRRRVGICAKIQTCLCQLRIEEELLNAKYNFNIYVNALKCDVIIN